MNTLHSQKSSDYPKSGREQLQRAPMNDSSSTDHPDVEIEHTDSSSIATDKPELEAATVVEQKTLTDEAVPALESTQELPPTKQNWLSRRIQVITDTITEWKFLRREIRAFPARMKARM